MPKIHPLAKLMWPESSDQTYSVYENDRVVREWLTKASEELNAKCLKNNGYLPEKCACLNKDEIKEILCLEDSSDVKEEACHPYQHPQMNTYGKVPRSCKICRTTYWIEPAVEMEVKECCDECSPEYINGKPSCHCKCHSDGREH